MPYILYVYTLIHSIGSPFIASVNDASSTADSGICLQSGICVSANTDTHGKYFIFYFLILNVSKTKSHVYTFVVGTEVPETKYNGDGIYRSSPHPSVGDREFFIDPQSPSGSSRLDQLNHNII